MFAKQLFSFVFLGVLSLIGFRTIAMKQWLASARRRHWKVYTGTQTSPPDFAPLVGLAHFLSIRGHIRWRYLRNLQTKTKEPAAIRLNQKFTNLLVRGKEKHAVFLAGIWNVYFKQNIVRSRTLRDSF